MQKNYMLIFLLFSINTYADSQLIRIDFPNWEILYNCDKRGFEYFHYTTVPDSGSLERYKPFHHEERLPKHCRQFSKGTYKSPQNALKYDRGHGSHQNIWDHNREWMIASNSMANIVPQEASLNRRGVWRYTEVLTECWRDRGTVEVWGGVIWGTDASNDHFLVSHGVVTPDELWKVIKFPNGEVNAWIMPNDNTPKKYKADSYLVAPATVEKITGFKFAMARQQHTQKDSHGMSRPKGCSLK